MNNLDRVLEELSEPVTEELPIFDEDEPEPETLVMLSPRRTKREFCAVFGFEPTVQVAVPWLRAQQW